MAYRASARNRASISPLPAYSGRSSFTATARPSTASAARHTSHAPPTAIRSCSRYRRASPPRQRNPRGTGDRLHGELVDGAVRVLAAHGDTERLSIRAVAAEAQVTPPAMYRCFPDRRALVRTAVETCFDRFETELAQAEQGAADPFEALRRRCRAYVAFGTAQPHLYRVMFGAWSAGPKALGTSGRRARTPARARSPR